MAWSSASVQMLTFLSAVYFFWVAQATATCPSCDDCLVFDANDASQYVRCKNGLAAQVERCPEPLVFNALLNACDFPRKSAYGAESGTKPEVMSEWRCPRTDSMSDQFKEICSLDENATIKKPSNCSEFYKCSVSGEACLISCPKGLHFNDKLKMCDWPESSGCEKEQLNAVDSIPTIVTAPTPYNRLCAMDRHPIRHLSFKDDCNKFVQCPCHFHRPAHIFRCSSNLHFNPRTRTCDLPENAGCETKRSTSPAPTTTKETTTSKTTTPVTTEETTISTTTEEATTTSTPTTTTEATTPEETTMPTTTTEEPTTTSSTTTTTEATTPEETTMPTTTTEEPTTTSSTTTTTEATTPEETTVPTTTTEETTTTPSTTTTTEAPTPEETTQASTTEETTPETTSTKATSSTKKTDEDDPVWTGEFCDDGQIVCTGSDAHITRVYSHPYDCDKFCHCSQGYAFEKKCSIGTYFDMRIRACNWAENVDCVNKKRPDNKASTTTAPPVERCTDGAEVCPTLSLSNMYPHPDNCKWFCHCDAERENASAQLCPANLHFNPTLKVCDHPAFAGCKSYKIF